MQPKKMSNIFLGFCGNEFFGKDQQKCIEKMFDIFYGNEFFETDQQNMSNIIFGGLTSFLENALHFC